MANATEKLRGFVRLVQRVDGADPTIPRMAARFFAPDMREMMIESIDTKTQADGSPMAPLKDSSIKRGRTQYHDSGSTRDSIVAEPNGTKAVAELPKHVFYLLHKDMGITPKAGDWGDGKWRKNAKKQLARGIHWVQRRS